MVIAMTISVVGATGAVGTTLLSQLIDEGVPPDLIRCYASPRSDGSQMAVDGHMFSISVFAPSELAGTDLAFFTAGAAVSREGVPPVVREGTTVIDNSSAFRMEPDVPLVVPEVNGELLRADPAPRLIANPNCSTVQLVCALAPLEAAFGLREVVVSTYQSVSGTGRSAIRALKREIGNPGKRYAESPYPEPIAANLFPHIGPFDSRGNAEEEVKMREETRKLMGLPDLPVSATTVRVPTFRGHGESVWVRCQRAVDIGEALEALASFPGVAVSQNVSPQEAESTGSGTTAYTTPLQAEGHREVFVGRVRTSPDDPHALQLWVMSDNLLKGAAWNAVQIARDMGLLQTGRAADGDGTGSGVTRKAAES